MEKERTLYSGTISSTGVEAFSVSQGQQSGLEYSYLHGKLQELHPGF
jgi:hypothetical protein